MPRSLTTPKFPIAIAKLIHSTPWIHATHVRLLVSSHPKVEQRYSLGLELASVSDPMKTQPLLFQSNAVIDAVQFFSPFQYLTTFSIYSALL